MTFGGVRLHRWGVELLVKAAESLATYGFIPASKTGGR